MRGRPQALMLAIGGMAVPGFGWFGAAVVGLVTLRKGWLDGSLLLLWASIPALAWLFAAQDPGPLVVLTGVVVLSYILRVTTSWSYVLAIAVVLGLPTSWLFSVTSEVVIERVIDFFVELSRQSGEEAVINDLDRLALGKMLVGLFAAGQVSVMLAALVLARWWQSVLYNPGGFGAEFRQLRLAPGMVLVLVALMVICYASGDPYLGSWILILMVPLMVSSIALAHWTVKEKKLGGNWLVVFYLLLLFFMQFMLPLLAIVAVTDSWIDLRKRTSANQ